MTRRANPYSKSNRLTVVGNKEDQEVIDGAREIAFARDQTLREIVIPLLKPFVMKNRRQKSLDMVIEIGRAYDGETCHNHPKRKPYATLTMKGKQLLVCRPCYDRMKKRSEAWKVLIERKAS